jgi:uncharacterized protein (DUF58 family)
LGHLRGESNFCMDTDHLSIELDAALLKSRRVWYYVALGLFLLSLITRQPLVFLASLLTLVIAGVPDLWYHWALRHLVIRQQASQQRLFFGEEVTLTVSIENQKWLPLPWLEVEDTITPALTLLRKHTSRLQTTDQDVLTSTWLLGSFQRVTRRYRMRCQHRGLHVFGSMRLHSSDPFGWLEIDVVVPTFETLLVYPLLAPVEMLGLASFLPFGDYAMPHSMLEDPMRIAGTREYVLGDDPRRIHWKATAHAGELQSKVYEPSSMRHLLVLLDTWNYSAVEKGPGRDIQELSISAAASLAVWALDEGYSVGLLANCAMTIAPDEHTGTDHSNAVRDETKSWFRPASADDSLPTTRVPFSRDGGQYELLLSAFARLIPQYNAPIERSIAMEATMFPVGTTVLMVSAASSLSKVTIEQLDEMNSRGRAVHLLLTGEPGEKAGVETYDLPVHYLGGKEKWHELIRTAGHGEGTIGTSATSIQLD